MFTDGRSKRILLIAHCILNQNAISDGTADFPGTNEAILNKLISTGVGIIQMPCPELSCLGLDRGNIDGAKSDVVVENTRIRNALKESAARSIIHNLVIQTVFQIEEYISNGFDVLGVVGINRSPSCGVSTTSDNNSEIAGEGMFISELRKSLESKNIHLPFLGVKPTEIEKSLTCIDTLLRTE